MRQRKVAGGNPVSKLLYHENAQSYHVRKINYRTSRAGILQIGRNRWLLLWLVSCWLVSCLYLLLFDTLAAAAESAETECSQQTHGRATNNLERIRRQTKVSQVTTCRQEHSLYDDGGIDAHARLFRSTFYDDLFQVQTVFELLLCHREDALGRAGKYPLIAFKNPRRRQWS